MSYPGPPIARLFARVDLTDPSGCWLWTGHVKHNGYGHFWSGGKVGRQELVHRASYAHFVGPIPDGLQIDHLCRTRICVNPSHLEAVTQRENLMRGESFSALNAAKTRCKRGHEFTPENTLLRQGRRTCLTCARLMQRALRQRKREERRAGA